MGDLPINLAVRSNTAASSAGGVRAVGETAAELSAAGVPCVVGVVVDTNGSTYRKRGALILLDGTGMRAGALSGGCLESEVEEHARNVITGGTAVMARFDTNGEDDRVFGSGVGCSGEMNVLLMPLPADDAPLRSALVDACARSAWLKLVLATASDRIGCGEARVGSHVHRFGPDGRSASGTQSFVERVAIALPPPPRVLLLGAGPETRPLAALARMMGWYVEVLERRERWTAHADCVGVDSRHAGGAEMVSELIGARHFDAVLVMNHNFDLDARCLHRLAESSAGYVGLLGPPARRDALLTEIGDIAATQLEPRLYAPVGLRLGGEGPEAIALAIVAQLQHYLTHDAHYD
ncbi:MAG TPA: XdhC family protein [Rhodanobacteraceae bacterium]|nr:XdhC family protein [Rhodanobacteraceae bacterium]